MNYPKNFEKKIGFDKIRELLKSKCLSDLGKKKVDDIQFLKNYNAIQTEINLTEEFKYICVYEENFPISYFIDVRENLKKIKIEGLYLDVWEIFELKRSLETINAIINFFKRSKEEEFIYLKKLVVEVQVHQFIFKILNGIIDKKGNIKDDASVELLEVRRSLRQKTSNISKRMAGVLQNAKREGWVEEEATLSVRDGKVVIPISTSNKRKIKGFVLDESATGKTSYIEPVEIIEINNEIKVLEYSENREIKKILMDFSDKIRPYLDDLFEAYHFLATIDFIRAKALLAISTNAIKPKLKDESILDLRQAIHPLLYLSFQKENKRVVPLDVEINHNQRLILISGPNAGGKSVCLKTVGLLQTMLQSGLLVPVGRFSTMGIFKNIFIDIGDEQSIENDLSTYSSHLLNMKFFTEKANKETLLLIDEFGTGTEPLLGGAIAEAILERLNYRFAKGVITTHYTNLKHFATANKGISNAAMLFDTEKMQALFQLKVGKEGSSFAFEIAKKIGLSHRILNVAIKKVGVKHINYDKNLQELENEKRSLEAKKNRVLNLETELDKTLRKYKKELDLTEREKKFIISDARTEAKKILQNSNKIIENTIRKIKHEKAEKEKTKKIRAELDAFKKEQTEKQKAEEEKINKQILKIQGLEKKRKKKREEREENQKQAFKEETVKEIFGEKPEKIIKKEKINPILEVGDKVKITGQNTAGEILEIKSKKVIISFGHIKTTVEKSKIIKIANKRTYEKAGKVSIHFNMDTDLSVKKMNFKMGLDLRGKRGDMAIESLMQYIDESIMLDMKEVKILHGKGNGILKKLVREYLQKYPNIRCFDERTELGGAGITIVQFD